MAILPTKSFEPGETPKICRQPEQVQANYTGNRNGHAVYRISAQSLINQSFGKVQHHVHFNILSKCLLCIFQLMMQITHFRIVVQKYDIPYFASIFYLICLAIQLTCRS